MKPGPRATTRALAPARITARTTAVVVVVVVVVAAVMAMVLAACVGRRGTSPRDLDDATIAVLNTARALHHEADVFESAGDLAQAAGAIERVLALRIPATVEEAEDIRLDAWGRLGELALAANDPDRALAQAAGGLREAQHESVMTARLFVVKGRALRALGDHAQATGDPTTADARRREAIDALETSIQINQRVLGRLADGGGA